MERRNPAPGTVHHKLVSGMDDPRGEPTACMAHAALLLASEPAVKVNGMVTYSWVPRSRATLYVSRSCPNSMAGNTDVGR